MGDQGGILQIVKLKRRRTRLGEFTAIILLFGMNSVKVMFKICMHCVYSEVLLNFGNFPETAWRAIHSRQAAHPFVCILLCSGCSAWR